MGYRDWGIDDEAGWGGTPDEYADLGEPIFEEQWSGRMFGVYLGECENGKPAALFHTEADAMKWLKWRQSDPDFGDPDYHVVRTDLYGSVWNSFDPDPKADEFENFTPNWIND